MKGSFVRFVDIFERPSRKKVLSHNGNGAFDFAFMLGHSHFCRVRNEAVVPLHIGIGPVDGGVVDVGLQNPGLEIIEYYPARHAAEEGECPFVTIEPHVRILTEDKADELVTA